MRIHELKTWEPYYVAISRGDKTFECRKNDRGFLPGDILRLREWDNVRDEYTGRSMDAFVTYIMYGADSPGFGIQSGYCVMAIESAES